MKKILLFTLFCVIIVNLQAQTEEKSVIKFNALGALLGTGSVFYEHKIDDKHSWQLGFSYMGIGIDKVNYSGLAVTPEYRIYKKSDALSGLYIAPYLRYQNYTLKGTDPNGSYSSFGGGVVLGRQYIYESGFSLDLFVGPSFNLGQIKYTKSDQIGNDRFGLRIGVLFGFGL